MFAGLGFDLRESGIELRRSVNLVLGPGERDHRCHKPLRGAVVLERGRSFAAGDAAHIVPPPVRRD